MIPQRIATGVFVMGTTLLLIAGACCVSGARINVSGSIPLGLYWLSSVPVIPGSYVIFCPPQARPFAVARTRGYITAGFCPGGYGYMMKKVVAATGDTVAFTASGVWVNGYQLPHSKPLVADPGGRPLPQYPPGVYTLNQDQVLLMSDDDKLSFDGRYFGLINRSQIKSVIRPVFTWLSKKEN